VPPHSLNIPKSDIEFSGWRIQGNSTVFNKGDETLSQHFGIQMDVHQGLSIGGLRQSQMQASCFNQLTSSPCRHARIIGAIVRDASLPFSFHHAEPLGLLKLKVLRRLPAAEQGRWIDFSNRLDALARIAWPSSVSDASLDESTAFLQR
jgi:hypothetical protein